jgi:hypothetical protein
MRRIQRGRATGHIRSSPLRFATAMASVRLKTFSFRNTDWTGLFTVTSVMVRSALINLLGLPAVSNRKTSSSLKVALNVFAFACLIVFVRDSWATRETLKAAE